MYVEICLAYILVKMWVGPLIYIEALFDKGNDIDPEFMPKIIKVEIIEKARVTKKKLATFLKSIIIVEK